MLKYTGVVLLPVWWPRGAGWLCGGAWRWSPGCSAPRRTPEPSSGRGRTPAAGSESQEARTEDGRCPHPARTPSPRRLPGPAIGLPDSGIPPPCLLRCAVREKKEPVSSVFSVKKRDVCFPRRKVDVKLSAVVIQCNSVAKQHWDETVGGDRRGLVGGECSRNTHDVTMLHC